MAFLGVFNDQVYNASGMLPECVYKTTTQNGGVISAANTTGGQEAVLALSGQTTAQAITTDSAANLISAILAALTLQDSQITVSSLVGFTYTLVLINNNTSSGAITLSGGSGVTINGTATVAITTAREFMVQITGPNSVTMQNIGGKTA